MIITLYLYRTIKQKEMETITLRKLTLKSKWDLDNRTSNEISSFIRLVVLL